MLSRPSWTLSCFALLLAVAAHAQDDLTERERREAAREEARRERRAEEERRRAEELTAAEERERERLEALGIEDSTLVEAQQGFFVRIDAWLADVGGADRTVARAGSVVTSATTADELDSESGGPNDLPGFGLPDAFSIEGERPVVLEYDSEIAPRVELGWRWGGGHALSARYWTLSQDASASAAESVEIPTAGGEPGFVLGGIDSPGRENPLTLPDEMPTALERPFGVATLHAARRLHGADSVSASGELEASRLDFLYTHVGLARPRLELLYMAGLSLIDLERRDTATFTWRSRERNFVEDQGMIVETVEATTDGSALGLVAGIAGRFGLTADRRWSLRFGVEASGLTDDKDLRFTDVIVETEEGEEPETSVLADVRNEPASNLLTVLEGDVAIELLLKERARFSLGYRHSEWFDALAQERFRDPLNAAQLVSETRDVSFSGPYVRFGWFF